MAVWTWGNNFPFWTPVISFIKWRTGIDCSMCSWGSHIMRKFGLRIQGLLSSHQRMWRHHVVAVWTQLEMHLTHQLANYDSSPVSNLRNWLPISSFAHELGPPWHAYFSLFQVFIKCGHTFWKLICIGVQLFYNAVLVSAVQQNESAIRIQCLFLPDFLPHLTVRAVLTLNAPFNTAA